MEKFTNLLESPLFKDIQRRADVKKAEKERMLLLAVSHIQENVRRKEAEDIESRRDISQMPSVVEFL